MTDKILKLLYRRHVYQRVAACKRQRKYWIKSGASVAECLERNSNRLSGEKVSRGELDSK
jgi:hypothetical protein